LAYIVSASTDQMSDLEVCVLNGFQLFGPQDYRWIRQRLDECDPADFRVLLLRAYGRITVSSPIAKNDYASIASLLRAANLYKAGGIMDEIAEALQLASTRP